MTDYTNPYIRLQFYNSMLINDAHDLTIDPDYELGISMSRLAEISGIPINIIRQDITQLYLWRLKLEENNPAAFSTNFTGLKNCISFESDAFPDMEYFIDHMEQPEVQEKFFSILQNGDLDDIPLIMNSSYIAKDYLLPVTSDEYNALNSLKREKSLPGVNASLKALTSSAKTIIHTKDSYSYDHICENLIANLDILNMAIRNKECISMFYQTKNAPPSKYIIRPLKLTYDSNDNSYYVLSIYNGKVYVYKLDRITNPRPCSQKLPAEDLSILDIAPCVWGNSFSDEPIKVKVKFYKEASVWTKVKKDLSCRTKSRLYEKNGFLYYEDIVYGKDKFRSWLYGYGSSAIVLEPVELQKEIIASLQQRLSDPCFCDI